MTKDGLGVILSLFLFLAVLVLGAIFTGNTGLKILVILTIILTLFSCYFFRDPERKTPVGEGLIISPADGKIIQIKEVDEKEFFKSRVKLVSIFMSVFDVHVNRIPLSGTVTFFNYRRGKFYRAFLNEASIENEQTIIGIENSATKILFKQIAGIIARRIVCNIREGSQVRQGERFGMIKFGSRLDIFLPLETTIKIKLTDKVKAGETIIGTY